MSDNLSVTSWVSLTDSCSARAIRNF